MRASENHLGIRIANAQQWRNLAFKCLVRADVVAHLNVEFLAPLDYHKVYFLFIEHTDVYLVSAAQQLDGHHVLVYASPIHITCTKKRIFKRMVRQVILLAALKVFLTANVVSTNFIEGKRIAQVPHVRADRLVRNL